MRAPRLLRRVAAMPAAEIRDRVDHAPCGARRRAWRTGPGRRRGGARIWPARSCRGPPEIAGADRPPVGRTRSTRRSTRSPATSPARPRRWPVAPAMRDALGRSDPRALPRRRRRRRAARRRHRRRPLRSARLPRPALPARRRRERRDRLASRSRPRPHRAAAVLERGAVSRSGLRRSQDHLGAEPAPALPRARPGLVARPVTGQRGRRSSATSPAGWTPTRRSSASTGPACWSWRCDRCRGSGRSNASSSRSTATARRRRRAATRIRGSSTCCSASIASCSSSSRTCRPTSAPTRTCSARRSRSTSPGGRCRSCAGRRRGPRSAGACWSTRWRARSAPDGGHVERSFHYHRYTLDFYLLALTVARLTGDDPRPFAEAARRLARFARTVADDRGRLARIGDDDGGQLLPICGRDSADASDSLALGGVAARRSVAGGRPGARGSRLDVRRRRSAMRADAAARRCRSRRPPLGDSGYTVCRTPRGDHLVLRQRAARLPERRPRPRRRAVDDADRGRPAAPRRSRHRLLHDRSGAAAIASARRGCTTR